MNKTVNARDTVFRYISQLIFIYIYFFFLSHEHICCDFLQIYPKIMLHRVLFRKSSFLSGIQWNTVDDENQDIDTKVESVGIYCRY